MKIITQTRLIPSTLTAPGPLGRVDYVPVLYAKSGEMSALSHTDDHIRKRLRPLVQLLWDESEAPTSSGIDRRVRRIARAIRAYPAYLDILRTKSGKLLPEHDIDAMRQAFELGRSHVLPFIPVIRAGEFDSTTVDAIAEAVRTDQRGAAVRYRFLTLLPPPHRSHGDVLREACSAVGCKPDSCDLLLDMGLLSPYRDYSVCDLVESVNDLASVGQWRSVALLGSSVPGSLGDVKEGMVTGLTRLEWNLWNQMDVRQLVRSVTFGDYGVQGPRPPARGGVQYMRASVRYTAGDKIHVARGTGPIKELGREQYRVLCRWILDLDEFSGESYTQGDLILSECARGLRPLGQQSLWREAATSHHLRYVVEQIGAQAARASSGWFDVEDYVLGRR